MGRYNIASSKTEKKIMDAYWSLYTDIGTGITVDDVCGLAKINRSTFYYHFSSLDDVLMSIKERQLALLEDLFARNGDDAVDYGKFIPGFQELFDENAEYLVPLVVHYSDAEFSFRYRKILEDHMLVHLKVAYDYKDGRNETIVAMVASGLVNMFLISLTDGTATLNDSDRISDGLINIGLKTALRDYGIRIGFRNMKERRRYIPVPTLMRARTNADDTSHLRRDTGSETMGRKAFVLGGQVIDLRRGPGRDHRPPQIPQGTGECHRGRHRKPQRAQIQPSFHRALQNARQRSLDTGIHPHRRRHLRRVPR